MNKSLGICAGASTIGMVLISSEYGKTTVLKTVSVSHEGNPAATILSTLKKFGNLENISIATTGRKFRHLLNLPSISEPQALESALSFIDLAKEGYRTLLSAGGETFMAYLLSPEGKVETVHTGNKCASGTGEFLVQQLSRMGLDLKSMADMDENLPPHKVSGRCSVFCKSDCTHALNKGIEKDAVVAGLARMMAGKCLELLRKLPSDKVALIGSCTLNKFMVRELKKELPDLVIPEHANCMEALGAALWAAENGKFHSDNFSELIIKGNTSFTFLPPLRDYIDFVEFHEEEQAEFTSGNKLALGLDVGSTTTKGVLVDLSTLKIIASCYLRTDGDPIGASRNVYSELAKQIPAGTTAEIMGVTGSGRNIAGLHAGTEGIINEITAHAAAAVHYNPEVDTIFEIGGQDAKYTWLKNSVPCDYAMNEACSAGTGSFLEESAKETLGIGVTDIAEVAFKGQNPPNFNDQCAAFIGSDLKLASQEGVPLDDMIAGLVYSICINYSNRVKGNRTLGNKIFMQGGVCYNKAVPVAMAALTGCKIIVPPHPGLTGAFGVAIEAAKRTQQGILSEGIFDPELLSKREVHYKSPFICNGAGRDCDLGCFIARIEINNKIFPFGGICNRFDNSKISAHKIEGEDLVTWREKRVYRDLKEPEKGQPVIGMNRSLLMNTWFPFYNTFFSSLGFGVRLPSSVDAESIEQKGAPFCHPVELAHGSMGELLKLNTDHVFLPHLRSLPLKSGDRSSACVLVQGEPYYLRSAFPELENRSVLTPVIHMQEGIDQVRKVLVKTAKNLGIKSGKATQAFEEAVAEQNRFFDDLLKKGEQFLTDLKKDPEKNAVALFGRPYNAFNSWANKSIPAKFSTRSIDIIPCDMLPRTETEGCNKDRNMYWATGEQILDSADYAAKHPQLFGTFITNFSCGPDSFLLSHFRRAMGKKPSLTLELDSHTADAGIETRIEAFLDIVNGFKRQNINPDSNKKDFIPARSETRNKISGITDSKGKWRPINDPEVILLIPSLGEISTDFLAASMSRDNIRYKVLPHADEKALKLGRNNSSCKECLPLQLTAGALLAHLEERKGSEVSLFLMPTAKGPCRFGQYSVFMNDLVSRLEIPDLAIFSPSSTNGYGGLSTKVTLGIWQGIVAGSILEDIHATIVTAAKDKENALKLFWKVRQNLLDAMKTDWKEFSTALHKGAKDLSVIKLEKPIKEYPVISLLGEIYVRHDPLARRNLPERLSSEGFIVRVAPVLEWMKYTDWLNRKGLEGKAGLGSIIKQGVKGYYEKRIRSILSASGLVNFSGPDIQKIVKTAEPHISKHLTGEAVLTVGASLHEIITPSCGVISIGPFGCMPSRVAESILSENFKAISAGKKASSVLEDDTRLPFLAIETDGNPFPQLIEARLEAFCLQASRLHLRQLTLKNK
ncbi:acyl-CoA dehydratase activase [Maridesulfovibrio ferrireducens]|uniref:acyl-CoA dehydratase activase n=1 Tax=Maridesulfovibrio ferrireducens TaxID=246191 RepID=UPI001A2C4569|nr:acyl-CoA dehydratase activase [Maridesulfovibrio ferrireducens]MBI9110826.1 activase [Maridesulfovibrio ferrireducens]